MIGSERERRADVTATRERAAITNMPVRVAERRAPVDFSPETSQTAACTRWIALGIFLVVLGIYVLSSPGRIDIIDGQARFDVTYNWLQTGRPIIRDNWIGPIMSVLGQDGLHYSYYGAPASVFAMPLVWLGLQASAPAIQPSQFLFSLTSSIFGAAVAPILFLFYLELGVKTRSAFAWTMVSSFATYVWPISNSTFDNGQHAFFALAAVYFGFLSTRRRSAKHALLGGLMAGVLFLYQEYFLLIIPALALSTLEWRGEEEFPLAPATRATRIGRLTSFVRQAFHATVNLVRGAWEGPGEARSSCIRYCLFLGAVMVSVVLSLGYNELRFGSLLDNGKARFAVHRGYQFWGNPLAGALTLLVSPGKSVFLYSPPLALALMGVSRLWRRRPVLVAVIATASLILVAFISCISFAGGDWCWGPRYLALLLPLWALAFPFMGSGRMQRHLAVAIIGAGFLVQSMGVSVENQRFFFERGLPDFFWAEDSWFYFKHSALFARAGETVSLAAGAPSTAKGFNPIPVTYWSTYTVLGPPAEIPRAQAPQWIRNFKVFYLPKPWPLWMPWLPPDLRPVNLFAWLGGMIAITGLGAGLIHRGFQRREWQ